MNTLRQQIATAAKQIEQLVEALNAQIQALPDNPRIRRLGHNYFVMSSKDLGNNWAPAHHDFKQQYKLIIEAIQRSRSIDAIATLQRIINEKKVQDGPSVKTYINLHPDVIEHLKTLL